MKRAACFLKFFAMSFLAGFAVTELVGLWSPAISNAMASWLIIACAAGSWQAAKEIGKPSGEE